MTFWDFAANSRLGDLWATLLKGVFASPTVTYRSTWPRQVEFDQLITELQGELKTRTGGDKATCLRTLNEHYNNDSRPTLRHPYTKLMVFKPSWRCLFSWCCGRPKWRWRVFQVFADNTVNECCPRRICPSCGQDSEFGYAFGV